MLVSHKKWKKMGKGEKKKVDRKGRKRKNKGGTITPIFELERTFEIHVSKMIEVPYVSDTTGSPLDVIGSGGS